MTPREKAEELVYKFKKYAYYPKTDDDELFVNQLNKNAKECALIAVDEIIDLLSHDINPLVNYWFEVKSEIEKL